MDYTTEIAANNTTKVHKICISNYLRNQFITTMPKLGWTPNINLACCFDDEIDAIEFTENKEVQEVINDELELLIWTDTKQSIYLNR